MPRSRSWTLVAKSAIWSSVIVVAIGLLLRAEQQRSIGELERVGARITRNRSGEPVWINLHGGALTRDHMRIVAGWPDLNSFVLTSGQISPEGLRELYGLPDLRLIELAYVDCGPEGLRGVARCRRLKTLRVVGCRWIDDSEIEHLRHLKSLESLDLSHTAITDAGLQRLAELPSLSHLSIDGCTAVSDAGLRSLAIFPALTRVTAGRLSFTGETIRQLRADRPNLVIRAGPNRRTFISPTAPTPSR